MSIKSVHPIEGVKMEISFASEIKGASRMPSGSNMGSGTMVQYPHGIIDASWQGAVTFAGGEQFFWWAHEKSNMVEGGKSKGIVIVTGFTNAKNLSWMNNLVIAIESEFDPAAQQFRGTGYPWK
ncbi:MAG: hypothetical protein ABI347_08810 [Nitrososphaera sp.]|jgi:hypothetical protein